MVKMITFLSNAVTDMMVVSNLEDTWIRQMYENGVQIKDLAAMFGYTSRGMKLSIQESYARTNDKMPDGRSYRHAQNKAEQTC
jgi:hypothetical protein